MRKMALTTLAAIFMISGAMASVLQPDLVAKLNSSSANEFVRVIIAMQEQADSDMLMDATAGLSRQAARDLVVNYLQNMADRTQKGVRSYLEAQAAAGQVKKLQSVFIVNMLHCEATPAVIRGLEAIPGIAAVDSDPESYALLGEPSQAKGSVKVNETDEIAWGVADIGAPAVWAMGYDGTGTLVGMIDTGVNYNHVDLADHLWNGGASYPNHGVDLYYNDNNPMDDNGHGTHTAGTVASDGTAGSQCGVAPNATIMAIKVLSSGGNGSPAQCISGINFALNHGCDIFSMSLGWTYSMLNATERSQFRAACVSALAGGMIGAIAAGNEGQYGGGYAVPNNVRTPGNCPPPWLHPAQTLIGGLSCVVTCGATNAAHQAAAFSSHGPVTWLTITPYLDYAYNPGLGLLDPDVAAPGENVKSLAYNNNTGYVDGWSGTSMATPHVAGLLALMLDKNPALTPAQLDQCIEMTSQDWGTAGKDNTFGAGRVDAPFAVSSAPGGATPNLAITLVPTGTTALPATGGTLYFNVTINNNETSTKYFQGWLHWINPSGGSSGTLILRNLALSAGASLVRSMTQAVAGSQPNGSYTFWGKVGWEFLSTVYASSSFPFTKGTSDAGEGPWVDENYTAGWEGSAAAAAEIPQVYALGQNYPNPFNPTTTIPFSLPVDGHVSLKIYNLNGQEVADILEGDLGAGQYHAVFNGSALASGIYLYRLEAPNYQRTMKLTLIK